MRTEGRREPAGLLILASRSPRRRAILEQLGMEFEVRPVDVEELAEGDPQEAALENARRKARGAARAGETVLGADTLVVVDGDILGKPEGGEQARAFLRRLSGRAHRVVSAVCLLDDRGERAVADWTEVRFRQLSDRELEDYVATGEWEGKAGAYAIQGRGAALVRSVSGDYFTVVGLPVAALLDLLER